MEGLPKFRAVLTFWDHSRKVFHKVSVIYMFNIFPHKTRNNLKYKIKDGLNELGVMGKKGEEVKCSIKIPWCLRGNDPLKH